MSDPAELARPPTKTFRQPMASTWWLRRPSYFLYMLREATVIFMAAWLVWFLYLVWELKNNDFESLDGNWAFFAFSVVCLFMTLYHAITFLNLSGLILRVPIGDRHAPAIAVKGLAFGGLLFVSLAGGALMIYLGYVKL